MRPQKAVVETTDNVQIPLTLIAWHTAAAFEPGDAALDVLASILGEGRSSRLYADLVTEKGQALEVSAWQYSQLLSGIFAVSGKPAEGVTVEELQAAERAMGNAVRDRPGRSG